MHSLPLSLLPLPSLVSLHSRATNTVLENHHTALADSEALKVTLYTHMHARALIQKVQRTPPNARVYIQTIRRLPTFEETLRTITTQAVFEKDVVFNNIFQHAVVERMRTLS